MNKAIYRPKGKAGEYARWACNLFKGCSNGCVYCYLRRGALATQMGDNKPLLKTCFKDQNDAFLVFTGELLESHNEIVAAGGLFFSFSTDPCLRETLDLTAMCVSFATGAGVPCYILTKRGEWITDGSIAYESLSKTPSIREKVAIGFSFSGDESQEPMATSREGRIAALRRAKRDGFKTFISLEPLLDTAGAEETIREAAQWTDHIKVGLLSGDAGFYEGKEESLALTVRRIVSYCGRMRIPVYLKESLVKVVGPMTEYENVVDKDYSLFPIKKP